MSLRLAATAVAFSTALVATSASAYMKTHGPVPNLAANKLGFSDSDVNVIENLGDRVPAGLTFTDGRGEKVALDDYLRRDVPVVLTLGYYRCPMLCNLVHEGLAKAITASGLKLGKDFVGFAVSFDPNEEPKSANSNQGRLLRSLQHGQATDWPFVLEPGSDAMARKLADAVGFRYKAIDKSKDFAHPAAVIVLAPGGKITRYIKNLEIPPRDFRLALVEAGEGRVGTSLDKVILTCFRYDPMTQTYTPFVLGFVRIGALLCFAALATTMAVLWRRELVMRRRRAA